MANIGATGPTGGDIELQESVRDVLAYEMWMLHQMHEQLTTWNATGGKKAVGVALYCGVLESFLLHARSLFCFFFDQPKMDDDYVVQTLFPSRTWRGDKKPSEIADWIKQMNKRSQHMTGSRSRPYAWPLDEIRRKIDELFDEVTRLGPDGGAIVVQHPAYPVGPTSLEIDQ
jgi:hypothetical protein